MRVDLFTTRFGGPYSWAKQLAEVGNRNRNYKILVHNKTLRLLLSPFYSTANLIHSVIPITFHLWSKPYVLTIKGDYTQEKNIWSRFYPEAIKRADVITVPSNFLKNQLKLQNALVIPNAINFEDFPEQTKIKKSGKIQMLVVSNFCFEEKARGIIKLFEVLNELHGRQKDFELKIVGEGKFLNELKQKAKKNRFPTAFLGKTLAKPHYYQADILPYFSFHDNMPNVLLEAMAVGLPVITNDIGAVSEFIDDGENGFIAEGQDQYLVKLESLLLDQNLREKIGRSAREHILKKFNWANVINDYLRIYENFG